MKQIRKDSILTGFTIIVISIAAFWRVGSQPFTGLDVDDYLVRNPNVLGGLSWKSITWAFTHSHAANWHPLTWIGHMLDVQLFGLNPSGHHVVNLALHILNALLLLLVLRGLTGAVWRSWYVAMLFAVHPLHVESVAWVVAKKDTLSTFFMFAAMEGYLCYARRPTALRYLFVLFAFSLGLLAKPMIVTLPFVLLLLDFWPLDRLRPARTPLAPPPGLDGRITLRRAILEKVPLLLCSATSSTITYVTQSSWGAVRVSDQYSLLNRLSNSFLAYAEYARRCVWPSDLSIYYPYSNKVPAWQLLVAVSFLLAVSLAVIVRRKRYPYAAMGWLWYLGTLVPVIGIVQVGSQAMADRYTYVPLTGIFLAVSWGAARMTGGRTICRVIIVLAAFLSIAGSLLATRVQVDYWNSNLSLYTHAVQVIKDNWKAHFNLGHALQQAGRYSEAREHYAEAARIRPDYTQSHAAIGGLSNGTDASAFSHYRSGLALVSQGRVAESIAEYTEALRQQPRSSEIHNSFGDALIRLGRAEEALAHFREAQLLDPSNPILLYNLGIVMSILERPDEAVSYFYKSLQLRLDNAPAHNNLAAELLKLGKPDRAIEHFREAAKLSPRDPRPLVNLGSVQLQLGQRSRAISSFQDAVVVDPSYAEAQRMLGRALFDDGDAIEAVAPLEKALGSDPNDAEAHLYLAQALEKVDRLHEALGHYKEAGKLNPSLNSAIIGAERTRQRMQLR